MTNRIRVCQFVGFICSVMSICVADDRESSLATVKYLALGDSYTIGESVAVNSRWPVQLVGALRKQGYVLDEPKIIAQTGWTTDELIDAIQLQDVEPTFNLVSLLIGVNDQYRGLDVSDYLVNFRTLLEKAIEFAKGEARRVIVLSIPDWGTTPFAEGLDRERIALEIDQFNSVNRGEAARFGVSYIDITSMSREATKDRSLIVLDGLHPSAKMYAAWVRLVLPEAIGVLGDSGR